MIAVLIGTLLTLQHQPLCMV